MAMPAPRRRGVVHGKTIELDEETGLSGRPGGGTSSCNL